MVQISLAKPSASSKKKKSGASGSNLNNTLSHFSMRFLLKGIMGLGGRFLTVGIGNKVHEFSMDLLYYKEISLQS